jgi:hypothetical protein
MQEERTSEKAAVLNPKYREVTAGNQKFTVKPWTLGQIARVSDHMIELGISFGSLDMNFNNMGVDDALEIETALPSADWGQVTEFKLFDAATGAGTLQGYSGPLSEVVIILQGKKRKFPVGALIIQEL